jgi:amino acid transporter
MVNASAFLLVRREHLVPPEKTYFRIPFGVVIPVAGGVSCVAMLATLNPTTILIGFAVIFAGLIIYYLEDTGEGEAIRREIRKKLGRKEPEG